MPEQIKTEPKPETETDTQTEGYLVLFGIPILKQLSDRNPCYRITLTAWFAVNITVSSDIPLIPLERKSPREMNYEVYTKTMYLLHKQNLIKALAGRQAAEQITEAGLKYLEDADTHYQNWYEKRQRELEIEKQQLEKEKLKRDNAAKKTGERGENKTWRILSSYNFKTNVILCRNIRFITKRNAPLTEIDALLLHPKGIFIIETKERHGIISGNKSDESWYCTPFTDKNSSRPINSIGPKEKTPFHNPFLQTKKQTAYLSGVLNIPESEIHTLIVFSNHAELRLLCTKDKNTRIIQRADLLSQIQSIVDTSSINRTEKEIKELYQKMRQ